MKKIINPALAIVVIAAMLFTACKKPDMAATQPPVPQPTVYTAPKVDLGTDIKMEIPNTSRKIPLTVKDADGSGIASFSWIKLSGPECYYFQWLRDSLPELHWVEEGEYQFELTLTGTDGLIGKDTIKVTVSSNLRKHTINNLSADTFFLTVVEMPEEVKSNMKWVFAKSGAWYERVTAGPSPNIDYTWGGYYYELLPGNKISVYGGYSGTTFDIIVYY